MRVIIYTGKGGVGKTSVAAATGVKLSDRGMKSLVVSTDLAHSLSDSFDTELSHQATEISENLYAMELNPQTQLESKWDSIYNYMVDFLKVVGLKDVFAEELTMFPGIEELFSLMEIHDQYNNSDYDALVLDFPPTASTIRLLSFFDIVGWYMERFFKLKRRSVKLVRTFTDSIMDIPLPEDDVFLAFEDIYQQMKETKDILTDSDITSVRLVMNPENMVVNESQRAYTYLNLYGFNVDSVIVNKLLPEGLSGEFYQKVLKRQVKTLKRIESIFNSLSIFKVHQLSEELKGFVNLKEISRELYNEDDPLNVFVKIQTVELEKEGNQYIYKLYMPFIKKEKFNIYQKGGVLILKVGTYKQKSYLPQVLSNKSIARASYQDDYLYIYFDA
ncbi:MAG: ArsA family ATPase [Halanaerobiales bacterium]